MELMDEREIEIEREHDFLQKLFYCLKKGANNKHVNKLLLFREAETRNA